MKKVKSLYNGTLEIHSYRGQKMLDSRNANYSYGTAHTVWQKALELAAFPSKGKVLLCGLGGGSIVRILQDERKFKGKVEVLEIDPVMIEIADEEFGLKETASLLIQEADAHHYIIHEKWKADAVIVDVSIDFGIPPVFLQLEFWKAIHEKIARPGLIVFNALGDARKIRAIRESMKALGWNESLHRKVGGSNAIWIARLEK